MAKLLISVLLLVVAANAAKLELPKLALLKQLDGICTPGSPLLEGPSGEIIKQTCQLKPYYEKFCQDADLPAEQVAAFDACEKFMPAEFEALLQSCSQEVYGTKYGIGLRHKYCTDGGQEFTQCVVNSPEAKDLTKMAMSSMDALIKISQCQYNALGFEGEFPLAKVMKNLTHGS